MSLVSAGGIGCLMRAMILAAGEGRRMQPLTRTLPKPLLTVGEDTLIGHQLARLAAAGFEECVVNIAYLGEQIRAAVGNGQRWGIHVVYSEEPCPLETGGAINHALPLLGDAPFLLINADAWLDYPLASLRSRQVAVAGGHLVLVPNPEHNEQGDFALDRSTVVSLPNGEQGYTFSGLSVLHPRLIRDYPRRREHFPLLEAFSWALAEGRLSGELYSGRWLDIGTPARLQSLRSLLSQS